MLKLRIRCFPPFEGRRHPGWFMGEPTGQRLNNKANPFGSRGKANYGYKVVKMKKKSTPRTKEEEKLVRDAREIKELAARHAPEAIKVIAEIMNNDKSLDAVRIAAAQALIDRGYGKATQTSITAAVNTDGKPSEIDDKSLDERITSALKRIERVAGGETKEAPRKKRSIDLRKLN